MPRNQSLLKWKLKFPALPTVLGCLILINKEKTDPREVLGIWGESKHVQSGWQQRKGAIDRTLLEESKLPYAKEKNEISWQEILKGNIISEEQEALKMRFCPTSSNNQPDKVKRAGGGRMGREGHLGKSLLLHTDKL